MIKLSVIIPSYKDPLLFKTIQSLLDSSELPQEELEIIAVWDGYYPQAELIIQDPRVRYIHLGKNRGMRGAINAGVSVSRGEFIARSDEHIMFSPGYDKVLTESCGEHDIMTGRRYYLDPVKWEIMKDIPPVDCEKLVIQDCGNGIRKFSGQRWDSRSRELINEPIIEGQAMQGSFWCMNRKHWDEAIGELDTNPEHYGPHYGDSHEMVFLTWKTGGRLMWTKKMWYAHKHRSFPRTHSDGTIENPANKEAGWTYSLSVWEKYWNEEVKPRWKT